MDFENISTNRKRFNGKPFSHWEDEAEELVIETLLRSSHNFDQRSLIGHLASKRLMEIATKENPTLVERVLAQKDRCLQGFQTIMAGLSP